MIQNRFFKDKSILALTSLSLVACSRPLNLLQTAQNQPQSATFAQVPALQPTSSLANASVLNADSKPKQLNLSEQPEQKEKLITSRLTDLNSFVVSNMDTKGMVNDTRYTIKTANYLKLPSNFYLLQNDTQFNLVQFDGSSIKNVENFPAFGSLKGNFSHTFYNGKVPTFCYVSAKDQSVHFFKFDSNNTSNVEGENAKIPTNANPLYCGITTDNKFFAFSSSTNQLFLNATPINTTNATIDFNSLKVLGNSNDVYFGFSAGKFFTIQENKIFIAKNTEGAEFTLPKDEILSELFITKQHHVFALSNKGFIYLFSNDGKMIQKTAITNSSHDISAELVNVTDEGKNVFIPDFNNKSVSLLSLNW